MIMPANPQVGDVYRPENIPGLVFEEVTVKTIGVTVDGPYGPVAGAIVVEELHLEGDLEDKTFAPGYGEFLTGDGDDLEALALAVPTDALRDAAAGRARRPCRRRGRHLRRRRSRRLGRRVDHPRRHDGRLGHLSSGAAYLRCSTSRWTTRSRSLEDEIDAEDPVEARNAAIEVARATLDFQLRHRPPTEIDRARFELWARQILVDADDDDPEGVRGDVTTLEWILDRFAHTLSSSDLSAIESLARRAPHRRR